MDAASKAELDSIKSELRAIIDELENISTGIRNDFRGIGSERCADRIDVIRDQYCYVLKRLNNLDFNAVTEGFIPGAGGGGGSR